MGACKVSPSPGRTEKGRLLGDVQDAGPADPLAGVRRWGAEEAGPAPTGGSKEAGQQPGGRRAGVKPAASGWAFRGGGGGGGEVGGRGGTRRPWREGGRLDPPADGITIPWK